jgi:predicted RNA-binding protein with PIN domain
VDAPSQRVLIVDGHSMIFQWPELRALHAKNGASAREQLTRALTRYQDATGTHVVVVFDGKGDRSNEASEPAGIQVFYSKAGKTADSVIERIVATYSSKYAIVVATDDYLERTTVESFGGTWISSETLAVDLRGADTDVTETIQRLKRRK